MSWTNYFPRVLLVVVLVFKLCIPEVRLRRLLYLYSTLLGEKFLFLFATDYLCILNVNFYILCLSSTLRIELSSSYSENSVNKSFTSLEMWYSLITHTAY